jgi:hypothetical protein
LTVVDLPLLKHRVPLARGGGIFLPQKCFADAVYMSDLFQTNLSFIIIALL